LIAESPVVENPEITMNSFDVLSPGRLERPVLHWYRLLVRLRTPGFRIRVSHVFKKFACAALLSLLSYQAAASQEPYILSMLPLFSATEIQSRTNPLAEYLSRETGLAFEVEVKADYALFTQSMEKGIDVAFTNPVYYATASDHHEVVAIASKGQSGTRFRGMIVTRADSAIRRPGDLVGKRVGYNGPRAGAAYLSQRLSLLEHGVDTKRDLTLVRPVNNKQENTLLSVYAGDLDAGFVRESALATVERYIPKSQLKILMKTAWIPQWALSVNRSMPPDQIELIRQAIGKLTPGHPVLAALKVEALKSAQDSDYDAVRTALKSN
jgi:phosphonate transport system substrate-binding protein